MNAALGLSKVRHRFRNSLISSSIRSVSGSCASGIWFCPGNATKRAGNAGGKFAAGFKWLHLVVALVHDKRRHTDPRQQLAYVKVPGDLEIAVGAFCGRRLALPFGKSLQLLRRACGHEQRREQLAKHRTIAAPPGPDQRRQRLGLLQFHLILGTAIGPAGEAAIEDQMAYALGMPYSEGHAYRTSLRNAEKRKAVEPCGIDHGLEILYPGIE